MDVGWSSFPDPEPKRSRVSTSDLMAVARSVHYADHFVRWSAARVSFAGLVAARSSGYHLAVGRKAPVHPCYA